MYIELNLYDESASEDKTLKTVFRAIDMEVRGICVPPFFLPAIKEVMLDGTVLATPIDYPYGLGDSKVRNHAVLSAIRRGANAIDLSINHHHMVNKKWELVYKDLEGNIKICKDHNSSLRAIMDYRAIMAAEQKVLMQIFTELQVDYVIPAPGHKMDSWMDNLLVARHIQQKYGLSTITNGGLYSEEHAKNVKVADVFGCKVSSIPALEAFSGV